MDLHAYPRPEDDTGIGIHWCAGISASAPEMVDEFWLPELIALGVKWVKIADQRGALHLSEALLAADIMPIVQVVRAVPEPGHLSPTELDQVERLIRAGVRYFEIDSEPDRQPGKRLPSDALTATARNAVTDMQAILARGGLPAIPALTPEGDWQLAKEIQRLADDALFEEPIWLAIHNYSSNRPLHYPNDAGHLEGAPLTQEFYYALAAEAWQEDPWQGRQLAEINDLRRRLSRDQPTTTQQLPPDEEREGRREEREKPSLTSHSSPLTSSDLPPDQVHWRAFELLNAQIYKLIGHSLPILSTANGYLINENADPRYPTTTPTLHMAQTLEICRAMMGTSSRIRPAPDYYFCTAFWLLAHEALESDGVIDEHSAWYSPVHLAQSSLAGAEARCEAFGWSVLPIVPLLKSEPKQSRDASTADDARQPPDEEREKLSLISHSSPLTSSDLPPTLAPFTRPTGQSVLSGKVRGGAGAELRLTHSDGFAYESIARTNGSYRFVDLPAGRYSLEVINPAGSRVDAIDLPQAGETHVALSAYGWGFEIDQHPMEHGRMLTCGIELLPATTTGTPTLRISGSEQKIWVIPLTPSSQSQMAHCEVGPLPSDSYRLEVLGLPDSGATPLSCQVQIERGMSADILFVHCIDEKRVAPRTSAIAGAVQGFASRRKSQNRWAIKEGACTVRLRAEDGSERLAEPDETGHYAFSDLPAGTYFLDVKHRHLLNYTGPFALDGHNQTRCDLFLMPADYT